MIVITGLDGSGKSSFLEKLQNKLQDEIAVLRVPSIESEIFKDRAPLYNQCEFVNYLGNKADVENQPSLKIIAMFGSMILFNLLYEELIRIESGKKIFCERHPLIDTAVYARIYHKVMHPKNLDGKIAEELELKYRSELSGIIDYMKVEIKPSGHGQCYDLLKFLFDWFSIEENYSSKSLEKLFSISNPDYVYFLDAPAEVLMKRIESRSVKEYHETIGVLKKMQPNYLKVLSLTNVPTCVVNTEEPEEIDRVFSEVLGRI